MKKFKIFLRYEKEEVWLAHMARQGWLFTGRHILYHFQKAAPADTIIRIDYRKFTSDSDFADYCALFEDSGWHHMAGTLTSGTQYFCKPASSEAPEDIFSDTLSKAGRYKRAAALWLSSAVVFMPLLITAANDNISLQPRDWYLTPGLWEATGLRFLRAFLFETPFALMRGLGWLIPVVAFAVCILFAVKSGILYRAAQRDEEV